MEDEKKKFFFTNPHTGVKYEMPRNPNLDIEIAKIVAILVDKEDKLDSLKLAKEIFAITKIGKVNLEEKLDTVLKGE